MYRSVDFAIIRPIGSKDTVEVEALIWLETLDKDPNMLPEWAAKFKSMYALWKAGQEPTPDGTHVTQWPAISKAQAQLLISADIRTVEDLAQANEQGLVRVGMGSRELQNKARAWLESAKDTGRAAEELITLRAQNKANEDKIKSQDEVIARLVANVEQLQSVLSTKKFEDAMKPQEFI